MTWNAPSWSEKQQNRDVLFDADDLSASDADIDDGDNNDDWGDFESGPSSSNNPVAASASSHPPESQIPVSSALQDLLAMIDDTFVVSETADQPQANLRPPLQRPSVAQTPVAKASLIESVPLEDETWDDFEASDPTQEQAPQVQQQFVVSSSREFQPGPQISSASQERLPPTGVPPPIRLISVFPSLFSNADDDLFKTLTRLPQQQRQDFLTHSATWQYLQTHLNHCVALAYILAGRKLRWKRDQPLAQSMRIGPAAAGGKGGMKLVGIDKGEAAKEDREAVDVISLYRARMGKMQAATKGAAAGSMKGSRPARLPAVPNIAEHMFVKTLKPLDGGIVAPRPCVICGLKRNERVDQVDRDVEDSFGEWWIDGLEMHLVCREFWDHEGVKLKGR